VGLKRDPVSLVSTNEELLEGKGARGSVVIKALCYKPEGRGFYARWDEFLHVLNPSGRIRPEGVYSPSNRNEYQKYNNNNNNNNVSRE
jgi:hypothetical protein